MSKHRVTPDAQRRATISALGPCEDGETWVDQLTAATTHRDAWESCPALDWRIWFLDRIGYPRDSLSIAVAQVLRVYAKKLRDPATRDAFLRAAEAQEVMARTGASRSTTRLLVGHAYHAPLSSLHHFDGWQSQSALRRITEIKKIGRECHVAFLAVLPYAAIEPWVAKKLDVVRI